MNLFIPQSQLTFIFFLLLHIALTSCKTSSAQHLKDYPQKNLILNQKNRVKIFVADSPVRQRRGLSGIQSKDFPGDWGMLFPADKLSRRQFWMPDTHFDLDIIFMSADYYVLDIHRGLKHFPFKQPQHKIPLSKEVLSQHVLELRSDSPHAASIQPGMILQFESLAGKND